MTQNKKIKIALVGYRFGNGGAERIHSNTSFIFDSLGYEVHNIVMIDDITYPYAGKMFNVGALRSSSNSFFNKINRFIALRKYIRKQKFDAIIDFRFRVNDFQELIIYKFVYKAPVKIQTVHLGNFISYLFDKKWLSNLVFKNFDSIVCIAEEQRKAVQKELGFTNLDLIYNSIDIAKIQELKKEEIDLGFQYVIAIGRYAEIKQFDKLIPAYSKSDLPKQNIHLVLLGEGPDRELLEKVKSKSDFSDKIHLLNFQENPFKYITNSLFLVQSSFMEGLPMVLLEALACEVPLVAFDCPTGPSEIVIDGINGVLVENQNFEALIQGMNQMVSDSDFYQKCKANTLESVQKFDSSVIENEWKGLMERLLSEKVKK